MISRNAYRFAAARTLTPIGLFGTTRRSLIFVMLAALWLCASGSLPAQTFTTLVNFNYTNGDNSYTMSLVQGTDGNLYGITEFGGANGLGTVFKVTPTRRLTTLYSFCAKTNCTDGAVPFAGLVLGTDGNFYGTTSEGGETAEPCAAEGGIGDCGTVFKITPAGKLSTLHSFDSTDGYTPGYGPLVQATNGTFYGTTTSGGANGGWGTVFSITSGGAFTLLHSFDYTDGSFPGPLIQATNGNFYGTTAAGGASSSGDGTVFSITPGGKLTTLHSFGGTDGNGPSTALVQAGNGNFYGTTSEGGANNYGTIFSLKLGLGPFVETLPTSGKVGAAVRILGTDLTGATNVTFNGTAAEFTVVSSSEITTTVPSGATAGEVKVVTPSDTLSSNVSFQMP
jgi:uncharacterized repeat protein (TIGR03803 family)